jgi:hypothetical protein
MRAAVFALAAVSVLSGVSAYADKMTTPALQEEAQMTAPAPVSELDASPEAHPAQLLDVQVQPMAIKATATATTPEPAGIVLMGSGLIGIGGLMWRRRSLTR